MFKRFKNTILILSSILLIGSAFALPKWTSLWKAQDAIALPVTQIISGGTQSGSYVIGGDVIANLGDNSSGRVIIDNLYNSNGISYSTGGGGVSSTGYWYLDGSAENYLSTTGIGNYALANASKGFAVGTLGSHLNQASNQTWLSFGYDNGMRENITESVFVGIGVDGHANTMNQVLVGKGLYHDTTNAVVYGIYNEDDTSNLIVIGNGASDGARNNAIEIEVGSSGLWLPYLLNYSLIGTDGAGRLIEATETDPVWTAVSGNYLPRTSVTTGIVYPGSDVLIPSSSSIFTYLDTIANDLGSVITTGAYILSGETAVVACTSGQKQVAIIGGDLALQTCVGTGWTAESGFGGAFLTTSNVTSNSPGTLATDDFVFGSTGLSDTGPDGDKRMQFDKSLGFFGAGVAQSTQWDTRGNSATVFGTNNEAQATNSFAIGSACKSAGNQAFVGGVSAWNYGVASLAYGSLFRASNKNSISVGYGSAVTDTAGTAVRLEADSDQDNSKKPAIFIRTGVAPSTTTDRMYNVGGDLMWNGEEVITQIYTNPTTPGLDFQFAFSGGLMEAQYYTGGAWTTSTIFTP